MMVDGNEQFGDYIPFNGGGGYPQSPAFDSSFSRWVEEFREDLIFFEHDLRNDYYDDELNDGEGGWVKNDHSPKKINEVGIRDIIGYLRMVVNKNTYLSYLKDDADVNTKTKAVLLSLNKLMFLNYTKYELTPDGYIAIMALSRHTIEFALRRARRGAEKDFLRGTTSESFKQVSLPPQNKTQNSFIPDLLRRGK